LVVLGELGINLAPLIAGAGVLGIALGFGAQTLVRDFLSGFFMLVEDQYGVGDVIDVGGTVGGTSGGVSGTVEGVSLRTTGWRDAILTEPDVWGVEELGAQSMKIRLVVQTIPLEQWRVARELRARIKAALDEAGVATPRETITYRRVDPPPVAEEGPAGGAEGDR